jgi:HAD superfamily hydrolase (TIGR01549 family)
VSLRRYEAVLFDWDDTLCYAEPHRYHHAQAVARRYGRDPSLSDVYRAFVRAGDSSAWHMDEFKELPAELGIATELHDAYLTDFFARDRYKVFKLYDDVLEVFERLAGHELRVGIISNNHDVERMVARLDVGTHLEVVVSPLTFGVGKPDPAIFLSTLERLGVLPEQALYVGDSHNHDVLGARAAGLTPVLIDRYALHQNGHEAEHCVETLHALDEILSLSPVR